MVKQVYVARVVGNGLADAGWRRGKAGYVAKVKEERLGASTLAVFAVVVGRVKAWRAGA